MQSMMNDRLRRRSEIIRGTGGSVHSGGNNMTKKEDATCDETFLSLKYHAGCNTCVLLRAQGEVVSDLRSCQYLFSAGGRVELKQLEGGGTTASQEPCSLSMGDRMYSGCFSFFPSSLIMMI